MRDFIIKNFNRNIVNSISSFLKKRINSDPIKNKVIIILLKILVVVIFYEAAIMVLFYVFSVREMLSIILDPILLAIIISPTLYFIVINPLKKEIKDRKQAEYNVRESQQRLISHLDNTPLAGIFWNSDFKVTDWNKSAEKIFGYSKEEALGKHANELIVPKDIQPQIDDVFKQVLNQTGGIRSTNQNITKDGKKILCDWYNVAVTNMNGKVVGVASLIDDITEDKKTEKELIESEEKYRTLFENNLAGVYVSTIEGKILDCNNAIASMVGYSCKEDILKLKNNAVNFYRNKEERENFIKKLKEKKELLNFESEIKRKDGSYIYAIENVQLIEGNILVGTMFEITKLKRTEEALKETNEFNESLIETIPFGLDIVDMECNILFMNNLLKDAVGKEAPKGKCWEFYKDDKKQCTECPLKGEMKLGETNICEIQNVFGGREFEVTHTVMKYKNQKALLEVFRDITEEIRAKEQILKLSRGVEQSPAMVMITDADGNIEFINSKVTEFTGYSKEELIGKNPSIFQSGKTSKETYKDIWNTILNGGTWEGEILNKRKNGEEYWESESISPILNDKGKIINFLSIKVDITEQIKARKELLKAKEQAEESSRIKSNFLANMSHELRTPMVGIIGFTEILEDESEKPELKEYATFIHEGANRLLETLNLILSLTKIEAGKTNIKLSKIDVIKNIKKNISTFDKMAASKNIYLKFVSDIEQFETETDERMFDQIINNLVNNAVKFTEKGGVAVSVDKVKNDSYLEINVNDTGIGIPRDKQEVIWEEFRQASEGASRIYEGTGLGLTITNNFVKKLGGEIKLESEVGKGSIFTVLLPIREQSYKDYAKEEPAFDFDKTTGRPKEKDRQEELKSLLYVDDDKVSREVVKRFLKGVYKIDLSLNGEEAIEKAKKNKYDGILMDINLNLKMDGIISAEKIKDIKGYKDVPIIAVTAHAMVGDREKYLQAGFTDYISKPFTKNNFIALLDKTIKEKN